MKLLYKILVVSLLCVFLLFIVINSLTTHCGKTSPVIVTYLKMNKFENSINVFRQDCLSKLYGLSFTRTYFNKLLSVESHCFRLPNSRSSLITDAYGNELRFSYINDEIVISSAGIDAVFNTKDDLSTQDKRYLNKVRRRL